MSLVLPIVLGVGFLAAGFGIGTTCTNVPGNGGLDEPPCNRVDHGVKLNTAVQVVLLVAALEARRRSGRPLVAQLVVWGSVTAAAASLVYATSY